MSAIRWTQEDYQRAINGVRAPAISERQFQAAVMKIAAQLGWTFYHTYDSIGSQAGFPDLVLAKQDQCLIFAELKTEKGKVSKEQQKWMDLLDRTGVYVYVWRPSMMEKIVEILR